jgi:hypothetical protein
MEVRVSSHELPRSFRERRSPSRRRMRDRPRSTPVCVGSSRGVLVPYSVSPLRAAAWVSGPPTARSPAPPGFLNLMAPSSAPSLLALFHARSAPGVHPSELCSSRAAVRRLRRLCPPGVGGALGLTRGPPSPSRTPKRCARTRSSPCGQDLENAPRLQGFAPHESPPHQAGGLGRPERVALLDFSPSGCSPSPEWQRPSPRLPSWDCPPGRRIDRTNAPTGCCLPARLACLSRDCRPSWGSPPFDPPQRFRSVAVRESPPQAPGCVTVPWSSHL